MSGTFPDWYTDEFQDSLASIAIDAAITHVDRDARSFMLCAMRDDAVESPIELKLLVALNFLNQQMLVEWDTYRSRGMAWENIVAGMREARDYGALRPFFMRIYPQVTIAEFRVDMAAALVLSDQSITGIVIECDGHDHHYNTKEKVAKDRARDRRLQNLGFIVLRFTGSEIHANAVKCAQEIISTAFHIAVVHQSKLAA